MTIEEITATLQTVAENQTRSEERAARLDETVKQIAEAHKTLIELVRLQDGRIDGHDAQHRESDERIDALINAQVRYEARQEKLEEAFKQVAVSHAQLVELLRIQENRLDSHDEAGVHTEAQLDALIDSQIRLTERVDTLTRDIAATTGRLEGTDALLDRIGERLDQAAELQAANAAQIKALIQSQTRTDEMVRSLLARNGSTKPKKTVAKKAAKKSKKGGAK